MQSDKVQCWINNGVTTVIPYTIVVMSTLYVVIIVEAARNSITLFIFIIRWTITNVTFY